jgi:hypothetical protein
MIERKVTVVTTTTWTISWQEDAADASATPDPDPGMEKPSTPRLLRASPRHSSYEEKMKEKEAGLFETKENDEQTGESPANKV